MTIAYFATFREMCQFSKFFPTEIKSECISRKNTSAATSLYSSRHSLLRSSFLYPVSRAISSFHFTGSDLPAVPRFHFSLFAIPERVIRAANTKINVLLPARCGVRAPCALPLRSAERDRFIASLLRGRSPSGEGGSRMIEAKR